jgi:hypothetical protein
LLAKGLGNSSRQALQSAGGKPQLTERKALSGAINPVVIDADGEGWLELISKGQP